ncbi:MAG TPA: ABC transporter substrate-binding protein [Bacillota bacterium]|nr:ABC transporter substrate-binding protein [Bacillota bacterium]
MSRNGTLLLASVMLLVVLVATGCPRAAEPVEPPAAAEPQPGGTLTHLHNASPDNLDPQGTVMAVSWWVFSRMVDTLVTRDHDLGIAPHLAESWEMSKDGLTWTFRLQRGIRFHDGTPFNAESAAFSFNRFAEVARVGILAQLKETVVVDEYTIEMRLTAAAPRFLDDLASHYAGLISPAAVEKYGADFGIAGMVGTGPFKFHEFIPGDRVTLVRNEEYAWGPPIVENPGPAHLERIELLVIPEDMTRVMEFEDRAARGYAVTLTLAPPADVRRLRADPAVQTITRTTTGADILFINTTKWPFDDIRMREALIYAINTQPIVDLLLEGVAVQAHTFISPSQIGYPDAAGPTPAIQRPVDPQRARELFAEAGWLPGPDGILVHQGTGKRAEFGFLTPTGYVGEPEAIVAQLRDLGLDIRMTVLEPAASVAKAREGVYELYLIGYGWPDVSLGFDLFHTRQIGGLNFSFLSDPQVDEQINTALTNLDPEVRAAAWNAAHVRIVQLAPFVPMWYDMLFTFASKAVGGMELVGAHPLWASDIHALDLHYIPGK